MRQRPPDQDHCDPIVTKLSKKACNAAKMKKGPGALHKSLDVSLDFWLLNLGSNQGPTD